MQPCLVPDVPARQPGENKLGARAELGHLAQLWSKKRCHGVTDRGMLPFSTIGDDIWLWINTYTYHF